MMKPAFQARIERDIGSVSFCEPAKCVPANCSWPAVMPSGSWSTKIPIDALVSGNARVAPPLPPDEPPVDVALPSEPLVLPPPPPQAARARPNGRATTNHAKQRIH